MRRSPYGTETWVSSTPAPSCAYAVRRGCGVTATPIAALASADCRSIGRSSPEAPSGQCSLKYPSRPSSTNSGPRSAMVPNTPAPFMRHSSHALR
jgi:hypothetical protein